MKWLSNLFGKKKTAGLPATKWCCIGFKSGYESAGSSGYSYLVGVDPLGEPEFLIQFRAGDRQEEDLIASPIKIILVSDQRILYCPSCGVDLARWYGGNIKEMYRDGPEIGILKGSNTLVLGNPKGW